MSIHICIKSKCVCALGRALVQLYLFRTRRRTKKRRIGGPGRRRRRWHRCGGGWYSRSCCPWNPFGFWNTPPLENAPDSAPGGHYFALVGRAYGVLRYRALPLSFRPFQRVASSADREAPRTSPNKYKPSLKTLLQPKRKCHRKRSSDQSRLSIDY